MARCFALGCVLAGLCAPARAVDENRLQTAIDRLDAIVRYAKSNNAAAPNLVSDLEGVAYELRQALYTGRAPAAVPVGPEYGPPPRRQPEQESNLFGIPLEHPGADDDSVPARREWKVYGSLNNLRAITDRKRDTRADSGTTAYAGYQVTVDLGRNCRIHRVVQDHGASKDDFPGTYMIEVSPDAVKWFEVFRGRGAPGYSTADFNRTRARYVRVTALTTNGKNKYWSLHELGIE